MTNISNYNTRGVNNFVQFLRQTQRGRFRIGDFGELRSRRLTYSGDGPVTRDFCPITAARFSFDGAVVPNNHPHTAAEKLGLNTEEADAIVNAADLRCGTCIYPRLRIDMLSALGL